MSNALCFCGRTPPTIPSVTRIEANTSASASPLSGFGRSRSVPGIRPVGASSSIPCPSAATFFFRPNIHARDGAEPLNVFIWRIIHPFGCNATPAYFSCADASGTSTRATKATIKLHKSIARTHIAIDLHTKAQISPMYRFEARVFVKTSIVSILSKSAH